MKNSCGCWVLKERRQKKMNKKKFKRWLKNQINICNDYLNDWVNRKYYGEAHHWKATKEAYERVLHKFDED